jgi:hypothetical protein
MIGRLVRRPTPFLLIVVATAAAFAAIMAALIVPDRAETILRWLAVAVGVLVVIGAIDAITARFPIDWRPPAAFASQPGAADPDPPQRLREIERLVAYAQWDAADFHARLRPVLRTIAARRLAANVEGTIDIDANPAAARAALGERVWALLEPKDPTTTRRDGGVAPEELRAAVAALEALDDQPRD